MANEGPPASNQSDSTPGDFKLERCGCGCGQAFVVNTGIRDTSTNAWFYSPAHKSAAQMKRGKET